MSQFDTENKDVLLATALAAGASASAARQLDLSLSTVKRRLADPDFRRLVADLRGDMLASALGRLTDNMTRAADTVAALLDNDQPAVRLRAARALLTLGVRLHDALDVRERVRQIEDELARKQGYEP